MPHKQNHRGANPKDRHFFSAKALPRLQKALADLSYLISRDYNPQSALKLVGDRYRFTERQRKAIARSACGEAQLQDRTKRCLSLEQAKGKKIMLDGYNQLIVLEAALSRAPMFVGVDGCYRDIASVHSTYRKVEETVPALELFSRAFEEFQPEKVLWVFDQPVSNSGRLRQFIEELCRQNDWNWEVILDFNPDKYLAQAEDWVALSSDSWVLDRASQWLNLTAYMIDNFVKEPWLVDLR